MVKTESPSSEEELYIRVWYMKWYFGNGGIANMTGRFFLQSYSLEYDTWALHELMNT